MKKLITYSSNGIHITGSKQGFTSRTVAETAIELREMGINI